jgi:hypothetical protein
MRQSAVAETAQDGWNPHQKHFQTEKPPNPEK